MAHSKIGASSYYRWSKTHGGCPASVRLSEGLVSASSEYAQQGSLAHEIVAEMLEHKLFKKPARIRQLESEMRKACEYYVDFVVNEAKTMAANSGKGHVLIEHKFSLSSVHPDLFGTADAVLYSPWERRLLVVDFKYGAGIPVEVEGNLQLKYYGLGALLSAKFPCETVELAIVQPRCEHPDGMIRRHKFPAIELLDFAADLKADAEETEKPDAAVNPGKHCRFCPAAATKCDAVKEKAQALAKLEFSKELSYDPEKLSLALRHVPTMEAWIKQVREFAYSEAMQGRPPPGFKLVSKRPTRKWAVTEEEVVKKMRELTYKDDKEFFNLTLKSPTQMEKLTSKDTTLLLRELVATVSSGYNLVPESDKRPAAKIDASAEFDLIEGETEND